MKNYTFVDYATQGYLLVVGMLALIFQNERTPLAPYLVGVHLVGMILIHGLIRYHAAHRTGRFLDFLRHFYPILLFTGFYRETSALHHLFFAKFLDPGLIRLETNLFGMQPSLEFMDRFPYLALSELFYAAYFSYYIMIIGVGIALFIRNRTQFHHYISVLSFVFYVCYLTYIIVPVMGPRAFYGGMGYDLPAEVYPDVPPPYPPVAVQDGPFFKVMRLIYANLEAQGAAFPSSHVAIAIVTLWFSFRYLPRIRYPHLMAVVLLCISTVYCRYHYVVDVFAGIAAAAALIPIANWLYFRFSSPADRGGQFKAGTTLKPAESSTPTLELSSAPKA
jgi:membrane-associated phospholipid phosphatase